MDRPLIGRAKGRLREGFAYVRTHPEVARPLLVMTVVGTVALNFQTTFPSMVRFGFDRGAGSVGTAMSVSAIGSIIGGIYIAGVKPHPRRTLAIALAGFAAACLALSITPGFWPFVAMSIVLGFASASFQSVNTVVLQQATEPSMQGRVMALHQMALVRQHTHRRPAHGLDHPGLVATGAVRARADSPRCSVQQL